MRALLVQRFIVQKWTILFCNHYLFRSLFHTLALFR